MTDPLMLLYIPFYSKYILPQKLIEWHKVMETFHGSPEKDPFFFNHLKTSLV